MEKVDWQQIRNIDLVDYLSQLGREPEKIRGNEFWYYSPFRDEKTPSFKVDKNKNVWYDWGEGQGGNLIDFAIRYHQCTVGEFLDSIRQTQFILRPGPEPQRTKKIEVEESSSKIIGERSLWSYPLLDYLKQRNIPVSIADRYCREVSYTLKGKKYFAIGFRNDQGGYELRNAVFKTSSSPKWFTHIANGAKDICVFEGFFDFLSFLALNAHEDQQQFDYLVLNSLSFFEPAREVMELYNRIHLYLDYDRPGQKFSTYARSLDKRYIDESQLYRNHKDLNNYHCHIRPNQKLLETKPPKARLPRKGL